MPCLVVDGLFGGERPVSVCVRFLSMNKKGSCVA
jgi:hypothetical protein